MAKKRLAFAISAAAIASVSLSTPALAKDASGGERRSPLQSYAVKVVETSRSVVAKKDGTSLAAATPATVFFTPQAPSYAGNSQYSHFTGQVHYGASSITFAWSDRLHANVSALATGPMTETATATRNGKGFGYKDTHTVAASYLVHSSFSAPTANYLLTINESFPIAGGTEYITTQFDFTVTLI